VLQHKEPDIRTICDIREYNWARANSGIPNTQPAGADSGVVLRWLYDFIRTTKEEKNGKKTHANIHSQRVVQLGHVSISVRRCSALINAAIRLDQNSDNSDNNKNTSVARSRARNIEPHSSKLASISASPPAAGATGILAG
jgi:hypothetical protein